MGLPTETKNQQNPLPANNAWPSQDFGHIFYILPKSSKHFQIASPATHFIKPNFIIKIKLNFFIH
jgi:hypothetical protein